MGIVPFSVALPLKVSASDIFIFIKHWLRKNRKFRRDFCSDLGTPEPLQSCKYCHHEDTTTRSTR